MIMKLELDRCIRWVDINTHGVTASLQQTD